MPVKPKDRDFIETVEGMFFCVVGYLHPPDRYTVYLKYLPAPYGKWSRDGTRYTRTLDYYDVSQVENTYRYIKENHPQYLFHCPVRNIEISAIPRTRVKKYYDPRKRLTSIKKSGPNDSLEAKLLELTDYLEQKTGTTGQIGVTGSILTGSHNPKFSDIDLTVYGLETSIIVKRIILEAVEENDNIKGSTREEKQKWIKSRSERFPLTCEELEKISAIRWNYGYFKGTYFSVHPTRKDEEIIESYGDSAYKKVGEVHGTATVVNNNESMFLPAIYKIDEVELDSETVDVTQLVSFEGLYGSLFENGEKIKFNGMLEKVTGKKEYHRVIIGGASSRKNYVKWD